jgi:mannose-1-phosphate guanylyltransferase
LIGIEPTFPSTGFGYIQRDGVVDESAGVYNVESFKEKPDYETACRYVESGNYLWNCGYFVGSVDTFLGEMTQSAPELKANYDLLRGLATHGDEAYNNAYLSLDNQVIDIALIEKANKLAVVSASFDWMDIGSFKDLHDAVPKDETGNYMHGEHIHTIDVAETYIRNEEPGKPVAVIGLDNVVVVNTPDGILVARKDVSAKCGDIAKSLQ